MTPPDDPLLEDPLVVGARRCAAELLLRDAPVRWRHSEAVAGRAAAVAAAVAPADRAVLLAAAWLHDVGYVPALRRSGFHPLDGAWHLRGTGWPPAVVGLVAQHSGARHVAVVLGLTEPMRPFDRAEYRDGPVADALTYADQTTGPHGQSVDVEDRLADMLRRHGPDSPNARCHHVRAPDIRGAIARTRERLASL